MALRAICFDMDGTLVDSEPCHAHCTEVLLKRMKIPLSVLDWDVTGYPDEVLLAEIIRRRKLSISVAAMKARKMKLMAEALHLVQPMPGAEQLLVQLSQSSLPLAIVSASNNDLMQLYLTHFNWQPYFAVTASGTDTAVRRNKPAPDVYQLAAMRLGLPPQHCLAIEDSYSGLQAARTCGMLTVGIRNGQNRHQNFDYACHEIDSLYPLINLGTRLRTIRPGNIRHVFSRAPGAWTGTPKTSGGVVGKRL